MRYAIDRLNDLCDRYGVARQNPKLPGNQTMHEILDEIDTRAGMDTRGHTCKCFWRPQGIPINQVGARIWRHERRLDGAHLYHHLGAAASSA